MPAAEPVAKAASLLRRAAGGLSFPSYRLRTTRTKGLLPPVVLPHQSLPLQQKHRCPPL